ncbi:hypothetical protein FIV37_24135 [Pseudomonas gessardii]|nr:hypothetical protein [Pseudomonas gessardii]
MPTPSWRWTTLPVKFDTTRVEMWTLVCVWAGLCGSWLACDADTSVHQLDRGDAIAGKPAPTQAHSTCFRASAFTDLVIVLNCRKFVFPL